MSAVLIALAAGLLGCASGTESGRSGISEPGWSERNGHEVLEVLRNAIPANTGLLFVLGPSCGGGALQTEFRMGYRLLGSTTCGTFVAGIFEPGAYLLLSRRVGSSGGPTTDLPVTIRSGKVCMVTQKWDAEHTSLVLTAVDERDGSELLQKRVLSGDSSLQDFVRIFVSQNDAERSWERLLRIEALEARENAFEGNMEAALEWATSVAGYGRDLGPSADSILAQTLLQFSSAFADDTSADSTDSFSDGVRARLDVIEAYFSRVTSKADAASEGRLAVGLIRTVLSARAMSKEQDRINRGKRTKARMEGDLLFDHAERRDTYLLAFLNSLEETVRMLSVRGISSDTRLRVLDCIDRLNASILNGSLINAHIDGEIRRLGETDPDPAVRLRAQRLTQSILGYR